MKTENPQEHPKGPMTKSMHDRIATWCDCCSCEAEPRWMEVGERMGMNFDDHEAPAETPEATAPDGRPQKPATKDQRR